MMHALLSLLGYGFTILWFTSCVMGLANAVTGNRRLAVAWTVVSLGSSFAGMGLALAHLGTLR